MIKFLANNLAETSTLTASTVNASFPVDNIKEDFRTKVWRSTSNTDTVIFDLGSIEPVDYLAIVDNWKDGFGISTLTIEANATSNFSSPSFTTTLSFNATHGVGIKSITEQSFRYWRFVCTSTLGYCELANVFIGKAVDIATNGIAYNWSYSNKDIKKQSTSRDGQEFIDVIGTRKELNELKLKVMNTTELDQIFEVFDNRGTTKPLFIDFSDPGANLINDTDRLNGLYKFTDDIETPNISSGFWETSLSLREQK